MNIREKIYSKLISLMIIAIFLFVISSKLQCEFSVNLEESFGNDKILRTKFDSIPRQFEFGEHIWVPDIRTRGDDTISTWLTEYQSVEYKTPLENNGIFYMGEVLNLLNRFAGFYTNVTADNFGNISFSFECWANSTDSTVTRFSVSLYDLMWANLLEDIAVHDDDTWKTVNLTFTGYTPGASYILLLGISDGWADHDSMEIKFQNFQCFETKPSTRLFEFEGRIWVPDVRTRGDDTISTWSTDNESVEYKTPLENNGIFYMGEVLNLLNRFAGFYTNVTADNFGNISFSFECWANSTDSTVTRFSVYLYDLMWVTQLEDLAVHNMSTWKEVSLTFTGYSPGTSYILLLGLSDGWIAHDSMEIKFRNFNVISNLETTTTIGEISPVDSLIFIVLSLFISVKLKDFQAYWYRKKNS